MPELAKKCIASWHEYMPDWEYKLWNEDCFDVNSVAYAKEAYEAKKYAFVSDYVRLEALNNEGGVYLDTDVEAIRPYDDLLGYDAFFGFESESCINTGLGFGSIPWHPALKRMMEPYYAMKPEEDGSFPTINCPHLNTQALIPYGLTLNGQRQNVMNAEILPQDFLNPYDNPTGKLRKTGNTISIHWYGKSWMDSRTILRSRLMKPLHRLFGTDFILFQKMRSRL